MKLKLIDHPTLGRLVPDPWNSSLMCFREIPRLRMFAPQGAAESLKTLSPKVLSLIETWRAPTEKLVRACRSFELFDGLRGMGVFEVAFDKIQTGEPSPEQISAYQYFEQHQDETCANVTRALLRYYQAVRNVNQGWLDDCAWPAVKTVDDLTTLVTFDSLTYTTLSCDGLAVLDLNWKPQWDQEHGLSMAVWKDQVLDIGMETIWDLGDPQRSDYLIWNASQLTDVERQYIERVSACIRERSPEVQDFDGENDDSQDDGDE